MSSLSLSRRTLLLLGLLAVLAVLLPAGLVGWTGTQAEREIRTHERLHYGVHLMAGRALSICPCTHSLAETQYEKAHAHAETPLQRSLVREGDRGGAGDTLRDSVLLPWYALRSLVRRPPSARAVLLSVAVAGLMLLPAGMATRRWANR